MLGPTRRQLIAGLALIAASPAVAAEDLSVEAREGGIALNRYSAARDGKRPAVLMLHGLRGFDLRRSAYERYAHALAAAGIDAYFVRYYTSDDIHVLAKMHSSEQREAYEDEHYTSWAARVSAVLSTVLARPDCSGQIGLLGFSLGGFVAATAAARDERVAALAVLYGGISRKVAASIKHLPPMIELHGEADRNVPLANGQALVSLGRALGAQADIVTYPGKAHGFDFAENDSAAADATTRVVSFFRTRLNTA